MRTAASLAVEAALHEAAAGPKPGLVDRFNSGAHKDMDLFTFNSSASVLYPYFEAMYEKGRTFDQEELPRLLEEIRPLGIEAEKAMLEATGGINTHKGLIFSLGVLCASAGYESPGTIESICRTASAMCSGLVSRELKEKNRRLSNGEKLYQELGIRGIRGEAEEGFPSVFHYSLPALTESAGTWNSRLLNTLLLLMTVVEDSNVIARSGLAALQEMKTLAQATLDAGGASTPEGMDKLHRMDRLFTEKNISPGGCADLLAVTIFLYKLHVNRTETGS